jgi:KUP system potassium uptake protein
VTQQAIQLGFLPRLRISTPAPGAGQIYIPVVNWALMIMVLLLVLFFRSSSNLAAAYGIAVTGTMFIDTCLLAVLLFGCGSGRWARGRCSALFFLSTAPISRQPAKIPDGGWFPLLVGAIAFTLLTTWAKGRQLMIDRMREAAMPIEVFIKSAANRPRACPAPRCS